MEGGVILLVALVAVLVLCLRRSKVIVASRRDIEQAEFHVARFRRALESAHPAKVPELKANLAHWQRILEAKD